MNWLEKMELHGRTYKACAEHREGVSLGHIVEANKKPVKMKTVDVAKLARDLVKSAR